MLCDGGNLWLQVAGGKDGQINKSWVLRYATIDTKTSRTGRKYRRERWMGLGPLHSVGLADARQMAADARLLIKQGKDPLDERNASRAARSKRQTFGEAAALYLE